MISRQNGQAMAEYVVVCAALITALFLGANTECDGNKCISKLLTVMHDSYGGYSSSISAVQKYGDFTAKGDFSDGYGSSTGSGTGSGSGTIGGLDPNGLTEISKISTFDGMSTFGDLLADGSVVDGNGNVIGFYSDSDNILTLNDGSQIAVTNNRFILDEAGNILHLRAVTNCTPSIVPALPKPVYSWAYVSKASGKVFNSVNKAEMDIGDLCTEPSFKVVKNGQEQAGRILNSEYYAAVFSVDVSNTPLVSTGQVIYWADLGICAAMVNGWDDGVDPNSYAAQLSAFADDDKNLGQIDSIDYFNQTALYGAPTEANDCPTINVISQHDYIFP